MPSLCLPGDLSRATPSGRSVPAGQAVHRDHGRATQSEVVLQRHLGSVDLPLVGFAAQLPAEFGALRQSRGSQGMSLGDEPSRRIDDPLSPVGDRAVQITGVPELITGSEQWKPANR